MSQWRTRSDNLVKRLGGANPDLEAYRRADADMIRGITLGYGPDSRRPKAKDGVRVVFNLSAVHVPALVDAGAVTADNRPFKNAHDIAKLQLTQPGRIGDRAPMSPIREGVEAALGFIVSPVSTGDFYYGAVELNGSGMRYYGDICLVLKPEQILPSTLVLYRNSYDLARSPIKERVAPGKPQWIPRAVEEVKKLRGQWEPDLPDMAVVKVLDGARPNARLLTAGTISDGLLGDEDFIEVVRTESFGWPDLEEARVSAADAGADGHIADRIARGPTPTQTELLWRHRRRHADRVLTKKSIRTRIVISSGRVRS
jgi:hypothetical protein